MCGCMGWLVEQPLGQVEIVKAKNRGGCIIGHSLAIYIYIGLYIYSQA